MPAEVVRALRDKQSLPLVDVVGRVSVTASRHSRARMLLAGVLNGLAVVSAPGVYLTTRLLPSVVVARRVYLRELPVTAWPSTLNTGELAAVAGIPIGGVRVPGLATGTARQLPFPPVMPSGGLVLARSNYPAMTDRPIAVRAVDRLRHTLIQGPTGTGKSTLLGVLAGRVVPDAGDGRMRDTPLLFGDPRAARAAGIVAIYQELTTVPALDAMTNVFLGAVASRHGWRDRRAMSRRFADLAERLGAHIDPGARADTLSVADRQLLEVMRALHADAKVIIFDEPTAPLAPDQRASLLRLMTDLREQGVTMLFVSHNLAEVLEVSDEVSVFRDGHRIKTRPTASWSQRTLVQTMLGDKAGALAEAMTDGVARQPAPAGPVLLSVRDLSVPGRLRDVSLDVRAGEIVGIAGLVGSGRTSLLRALAGLERTARGEMRIRSRPVAWPRTVRAAIGHGIAMVPEDRKDQGLVLGLPAMDNVAISDLRAVATRGWAGPRRIRERVAATASSFGFDPGRLGEPTANLSGGNQQKVLLARWAHRRPAVLLADEPTRGIDIGAKAQILCSLRDFVAADASVVMVSSEHEELLTTADRILVLAGGRLVAEFDNTAGSLSEQDLLNAAFELEDPCATA